MENFAQVQLQLPYQERCYTDRNGQNQVFSTLPLVLSDGVDKFYAELQGDTARAMKDVQFDQGRLYRVQTQMSVREYKDKDGNVRYSNEIRITKIG